MRQIFCYMGVISLLFVGACDSNKKLSQDNAEKVIKAFASTHSVSPIPGGEDCSFNVQSIASIEPLSQFSDTEATSVVRLKCTGRSLPLKFVFKKDIDNRWFLTKIDRAEGGYYTNGIIESMVSPNQNLRVPAQ